MFRPEEGWSVLLEVIVRVAIIYVGCLVMLRVSGRRELSQLSPMDVLVMLLISETVSPALTKQDTSLTTGLVAAATLVAMQVATAYLVFRSRRAQALLEGNPLLLIRDGKLVAPELMRRYRITDAELHATLRQQGALTVSEVARAYVEPDGTISVVTEKDFEESQRRRQEEIASRGHQPPRPDLLEHGT